MTEQQQKKLAQIRALLDKAESTEFPDEAQSLSEKAQELMTRYMIDEIMLAAARGEDTPDEVVTRAIEVNNPNAASKMNLLTVVLRANDCHVVVGRLRNRRYGSGKDDIKVTSDKQSQNYRPVWATGFSRDIDAAVMLYTSLLIQLHRELAREIVPSYENKGTFKEHFILGYGQVIRSKLAAGRKVARQTATAEYAAAFGGDLLPVLAAKEERVKAAYEERWGGKLRKGRTSYRSFGSGYDKGKTAAGRADLGQPRVGSQRSLERGQ